MIDGIYIYHFHHDVLMDEVADSLHLAAIAAEGLHGATRVRLEARFVINHQKRTVRIEASNGVGRDLARIFTGLVGRQFGEDTYVVDTGT